MTSKHHLPPIMIPKNQSSSLILRSSDSLSSLSSEASSSCASSPQHSHLLPCIHKNNKGSKQEKTKEIKKTLKEYVNELPEDIQRYIYKEYLEPVVYLRQLNLLLESDESMRLDIVHVRPFLPTLLAKKNVIPYLYKNNIGFRYAYHNHKIDKRKSFTLMNKGNSFALEILMYLYH